MSTSRRNFVRSASAGLIGYALAGSATIDRSASSLPSLYSGNVNDDEQWWYNIKQQFPLEDGLHYFNNGSLGPSPRYVVDKTEKYRRMLDGFPSRYMWGGWNSEKEEVRRAIADYFSVSAEEIAVIHNTSEGMNLFARSFNFKEGDEIIVADHEHPTGVHPYYYYSRPLGVKIVRPELPILPGSPDELTEVYRRAITPRTRLISMVHMTNTNGMILPVKEVSQIAHERGIEVCVDGAQAVGMIGVDLKDLECDFYAASGHKWLFGPKGTGILYVREEKRDMLKPLMVSSNWERSDIRMFEDYNTRNLPELLGLGAAIEYNRIIGQERKEERIYTLKRYFRSAVEEDRRFILKTPVADTLSAGIQVIEVSGRRAGDVSAFLFDRYRIDCRPMNSHGLNALRISLSVFNTIRDIDVLIEGLREAASM